MAGTKIADTFVAVAGDLRQWEKDKGQVQKEALSLGQQIKQALTNPAGFGGTSKVAGLISDLRLGRSAVASLKDATTGLGGSLKGLSVSGLTAGLGGIKSLLGGIKGALGDVFKGLSIGLGIVSFQALGRAISDVINFIPDLISKGEAYGNQVDQIADATGATAEASSKLAGTLQFLGAPIGSIVNLLGQMSRNLDQNKTALKAAGVVIEDVNGATLNQVQILENARQAFQRYGDGTEKAAIIAREFGRGGLQVLIDYLKLTDEQAAKITADLQAQGLILTESQRNLAEAATREGNRFQNALTGLGVTLFTVVGPQISAFMSNLTDAIEAHVDDIKNAVSSAVSFILGLVSSLTGITAGTDFFSNGIENASAVTSPYSAKLLQLNVELADLQDKQKGAADSTDAAKQAMDRQIATVQREIDVLKAQDKAQQGVFDRQIAGLSRVYQLRLDALDLAEKERAAAQRQADLDERLRQSKIDLFEAQAQLRANTLAGKPVDQDLLTIAEKQRAVVEAQQAIAENARQISVDAERAQLEATKAYIESIGELLDKAENKRAALANLKRRQAVLDARQQAQLASGDTAGAADTAARLEAIKTAEARAQEEIRTGVKQTALEKQKTLLEQEKAAIKSVTDANNAAAIQQTKDTIDALEKQQAAWDKMSGAEKAAIHGVSDAINGKTGGARRPGSASGGPTSLVGAINEAREAGVKFGEDFKTALEGIGDMLGGLVGLLGTIKSGFDDIAKSPVFTFLTGETGPKVNRQDLPPVINPRFAPGEGLTDIVGKFFHDIGVPGFAQGGIVSGPAGKPQIVIAHGGEAIFRADQLAGLGAIIGRLSAPQIPQMARAYAGSDSGTLIVERLTLDFGDRTIDMLDQKLAYRRR